MNTPAVSYSSDDESVNSESDSEPLRHSPSQAIATGESDISLGKRARALSDTSSSESYFSSDVETDKEDLIEPKRKMVKAGDGTSQSAVASRALREKVKQGSFVADPNKLNAWRTKIMASDSQAEFDNKNVRTARHSVCGKWVTVKEPYDTVRWKEHLSWCKEKEAKKGGPKLKTLSLFAFGVKKVTKAAESDLESSASSETLARPKITQVAGRATPCPGICEVDDPRIGQYLKRTTVLGGGGKSLKEITRRLFTRVNFFSQLESDKDKNMVLDSQMHGWQWRNDHLNQRVYSTACQKVVYMRTDLTKCHKACRECLSLLNTKTGKAFKNAISIPIPEDKNYIFLNKRYRNTLLGTIYAKCVGVREIIEDENARTSPFVKFAKGALAGKYDNSVFNGLVHAFVAQQDRIDRGVGMQNFAYPPEWEEVCSIARIHSSRAYRSLRDFLPMPTERHLQNQSSKQPRFPMEICDRSFKLVVKHLESLRYTGPVGLSCDDSKLFATFRLYWDPEQRSYFLLGGDSGPLRVADPDAEAEVIKESNANKASLLRLWCLTVPVPKISPIIVAVVPINSLKVPALLRLHLKIMDGLIDHNVPVVSYACDGTVVERNVQREFMKLCDVRTYSIESPDLRRKSITIPYAFYRGQPICMVQDSKHALKTLRNNLYSGARLLTFGNYTAVYGTIALASRGAGTPLYARDVIKVDRQDDNAAVRLFSADVLQYLANNHPTCIGEIIFLFVFGELIDAYQNRKICHCERLKMVLRAKYFIESWTTYLKRCGLSTYPTNEEVCNIAEVAPQEANSLVMLLGVSPDILHPLTPSDNSMTLLPGPEAMLRALAADYYEVPELDLDTAADDMDGETTDHRDGRRPSDHCNKKFGTIDEEEMEDVVAQEYRSIRDCAAAVDPIPTLRLLQLPDDVSKPFGSGSLQHGDLGFDMLVKNRRRHQTKQAATGVRTRKTEPQNSKSDELLGSIVQQFHRALREAQDDQALGTGKLRNERWRTAAPGGKGGVVDGTVAPENVAGGDSANASTVATTNAQQAATKRKKLFDSTKITELAHARVSVIRPLQIGDLGFVFTAHGIMLAHVIGMAAKSSGKYGAHCPVTETSNISAVSNITVQVFQYHVGRHFRVIPTATSDFQKKHFQIISSLQFLCLIGTKVTSAELESSASLLEILPADMTRFNTLKKVQDKIAAAMKSSKKRGSAKAAVTESSENLEVVDE
ncbi:hypothetical protein D9613_012841 [Agrocybe pediades]|uniref:Uncharacterized protein n=1 Tax=Agrocybe pediades TaxID=84607 RepID=A0A8H4VPC1_9AGAR|nr:hypothetical protein D9613_012841 [Agrocybe pediades]